MKKVLIIFFLFLTIPNSLAWDLTTHEFICDQIYQNNKELNKILDHNQFLKGCNAPDIEFDDQQNHHCYVAKQCHAINTSKINPVNLAYFTDIEDCIEENYFDCPALEKFEESLENASKNNYSFYIGVSTHYFTDAYVPLHQVMGEDWFSCHLSFEKQVSENIKKGEKFWTVTQNCDVYFPCEKIGKVNRKCEEKYNVNINFSYTDFVRLIEKTDQSLSQKLNLSYKSDYSHLLRKQKIEYLELFFNKIINFFEILMGRFKR